MKKKACFFGANSGIAKAVIQKISNEYDVLLISRNEKSLEVLSRDIQTRCNSSVSIIISDLSEISYHEELLTQIKKFSTTYDLMFFAQGTLPDHESCINNPKEALEEINNNFNSLVSLILHSEKLLRERGVFAVISSVAGDRGRKSNYIYGAAKGGLSVFLQGLRNDLYHKNKHVLTIKPGFVSTAMTKNLRKNFLFVTPEQVANDIVKAINANKDEIYTPSFWLIIMAVIKIIPEKIFKRLRL